MARRTTLTLVPAPSDAGAHANASPYRVGGVLTTSTGNKVVALSTRRRTAARPWPPDGRDAA